MKPRKTLEWTRLDNAAKIFPSNSNKRDTKVFRFSCELNEPVDPEVLQVAVDKTLGEFPMYRSVMKRGLFWYYFEASDRKPVVKPEDEPPCGPLYNADIKGLLFEVSYYRNRINLEVYHALSDGTGALQFLRVLAYHYLTMKHAALFSGGRLPVMDYDASFSQKKDDSFQKYSGKPREKEKKKRVSAYRIKGQKLSEHRLRVIEGVLPVGAAIEKAHAYGATLSVFFTAVLMCAIHADMAARAEKRPVVITVPVNLRNYFYSVSARNFFSVINVAYDFANGDGQLSDVIRQVARSFREELTAERLKNRMDELSSIEHNVFARITPLVIKDVCLHIAHDYTNRGITAALSNIGKIEMPEALCPFIRQFDVFVSTDKLQVCMCSFGDKLTLSFTSPFVSTDVQMQFFRMLTYMGIPVTIVSNQIDEE